MVTLLCCGSVLWAQSPMSHGVIFSEALVPMRDGITLSTSVGKPDMGGPAFPVIFVRTPYGKGAESEARAHFIQNGYVVVTQDCRGTGESAGSFEPYLQEKEDGYDALEWISEQPWCDGNVGMIGASYAGQVQWLAAAGGHPVLKTIIPQVSGTDPFLDVPYDHGILKLSMIMWAYNMTYPERELRELDYSKLYTLPVSAIDEAFFGVDIPIWNGWTRMDGPSDWSRARFLDELRTVDIPVLYVSGVWDVEALSTQLNWQRMQAYGHHHQHLLFGPWEHTGFLGDVPTTFAGQDYGYASRLDFEAIWLRWFDRWLKGADHPEGAEKPVRLFVTGANEWRSYDQWPGEHFAAERYHFDLAHERDHTYALRSGPVPLDTAMYVYDPEAVRLNMDPEFSDSVRYMRHPEAGEDLALLSDVFTSATTLGGPAYVDLAVAIDQRDVDLFVLLAEVDSAGKMNAITHPGKVRARFRDGRTLQALTPGEFHKVRIDLFPFAHQFKKGSRLAVIVRSDWFPRYIRNLGTADPITRATRMSPVHVRISSESELLLYRIPY